MLSILGIIHIPLLIAAGLTLTLVASFSGILGEENRGSYPDDDDDYNSDDE